MFNRFAPMFLMENDGGGGGGTGGSAAAGAAQGAAGQTAGASGTAGGEADKGPVPYDRFQQVIKERNELEGRLKKLEEEQQKAQQKQLEEQNNFKGLFEKEQQEHAKTKSMYEQERLTHLRVRVAVAKGLPLDVADRLKGSTQEELEADADGLAALLKGAHKGGKGVPPPPGGGEGGSGLDPASMSPAEIRQNAEKLLGGAKT